MTIRKASSLFAACGLGAALCLAVAGCHFAVSFGQNDQTKVPPNAYKSQTPAPAQRTGGGQAGPAAPAPGDGSVVQTSHQRFHQTGYPTAGVHPATGVPIVEGLVDHGMHIPAVGPIPRELQKRLQPTYVIEPPDVVRIEAIRLIPRPPYRIEPLDVLLIQVAEALPNQPINGLYPVSPDGTVNLGYSYGPVRVVGMTPEQAAVAVRNSLSRSIKEPQVSVALAQFRGAQQARGIYLVGQDGSITLGSYGSVCIAGLTVAQAKVAIERHLSRFLLDPEISLEVIGFNSKVYYVVYDGGGFGQQVYRFPITGNETVLDAIAQLNGLPAVSSKRHIWLARPAPAEKDCFQIMPVDWEVITQAGATETNYQLFPGDRIYVKADPLISIDNTLAKLFAPLERIFGITLLGNATVRSFGPRNGNNSGLLLGAF